MSDKHTIHFTFGSPQDFISQARRTRDLWAGSYIMSYLAGKAMRALEEENTDSDGSKRTIIFPAVEKDPLMRAIREQVTPDKTAEINTPEYLAAMVGSLPNRFSAKVQEPIDGKVCVDAIKEAWKKIQEKALEHLKLRAEDSFNPDMEIWDRQVKNTWEFSWVIGDEHNLLDQRKNLRTHYPPPEKGEKCTICGERQALSKNECDRKKGVKKWWEDVAKDFNGRNKKKDEEGNGLHFNEEGKERLCAVCTIKRIFPLIAKQAIGWEQLHNYPSTPYLAAIDWIIQLLDKTEGDDELSRKVTKFIAAAKDACKYKPKKQGKGETATKICGIHKHPQIAKYRLLEDLDGNFFFPDTIRNKERFLTHLNKKPDGDKIRKKVFDALNELIKQDGLEKQSPFYALLLMDGDNMGQLLATDYPGIAPDEHKRNVSDALAKFTAEVPKIVYDKNGVLIYAGGDDVFAMMPLNSALECAKEIKDAYLSAFKSHVSHIPPEKSTISAAIVYSHMNNALGTLIKDVHKLLDDVAKGKTGRNAFAVRVWKRGGPIITFAKKWDDKDKKIDWIDELKQLKEDFGKDDYSSKFFYKIRTLFDLLEPQDGADAGIFNDRQREQLLASEYMKNRTISIDLETAEKRVKKLLAFCEQDRLNADGAMLLRFLDKKGV